MTVRPIVKAVLFALAEMRYGPKARDWGLWCTPRGDLIVMAVQ